jgi:hypothetical protein
VHGNADVVADSGLFGRHYRHRCALALRNKWMRRVAGPFSPFDENDCRAKFRAIDGHRDGNQNIFVNTSNCFYSACANNGALGAVCFQKWEVL